MPATRMNDTNIPQCIRDNSNRIIPIVCDDMFECVIYDNSQTIDGYSNSDDKIDNVLSIKEYIGHYIQQNYQDISEVVDAINVNLLYGLTLMSRINGDFSNTYFNLLKTANLRLKPSVEDFLLKLGSDLILTTFPLPIIESSFNSKYTDSIISENVTQVDNICISKIYYCDRKNDLPLLVNGKIVVYHLFGMHDAEDDKQKMVVSDEDTLLSFMHSFHNESTKAKSLLGSLNEDKRLLVLGSSLPNWLFRFLFFPMNLSQNGLWLSAEKIDDALNLFLAKKQYKGYCKWDFQHYLLEATEKKDISFPIQKRQTVFVSYKTETNKFKKSIIDRIFDLLSNDFIVWRDVDHVSKTAEPYWRDIKEAIKKCDFFVSIVSIKYIREFDNEIDFKSLFKEVEDYGIEKLKHIGSDCTNDPQFIQNIEHPVARELYYAALYNKTVKIIVVKNGGLSQKSVEEYAKGNPFLNNLSGSPFIGKQMELHDDENPKRFKNLIDDH